MSQLLNFTLGIWILSLATTAQARDSISEFEISTALNSAGSENLLDIKLYFGDQKHPSLDRKISGDVTTSQKSNAFGKSDETACNRAFLSAIIALQKRASRDGGNAVTNIRSNYKHNQFSSQTHFQCGAGNVIAGVALIGDTVKLNK
jgi:uncharacterized protein YbjQ (UPF0145 family)